jgi:F-type H+-transporting ATPase subunit alpha
LQAGALENTIIVAADAVSCPGMQYLAPYAGATIAEWFREQGGHALVIYDDLTKHADAYRELALLLDRPPGREAFPGDIFHVHSELLERAAALTPEYGGGSVTALPLIETTEGDISSYIPTNLISITDGQIYLDTARFEKNLRPAVDIGRSVSRIGSKAQNEIMKFAAKNVRIQISRFESLESLTRVGLEMDSAMNELVRKGNLLRQLLRQTRLEHRDPLQQSIALLAVRENWLDDIPADYLQEFLRRLDVRIRSQIPDVADQLSKGQRPEGDWLEDIGRLVNQVKSLLQFQDDSLPPTSSANGENAAERETSDEA